MRLMRRKHFSVFVTYVSILCLLYTCSYLNQLFPNVARLISPEALRNHQIVLDNYYRARRSFITSNLGRYLFKYPLKRSSYDVMEPPARGYYDILFWKHWDWLQYRHVRAFSRSYYDPLLGCSVKNCRFHGNDSLIMTVDVVVVHLHKGALPVVEHRNPAQRWVFWSDESPWHTYTLSPSGQRPAFQDLADTFNWSMTYRSDSDIPVPYGRTIPLQYSIFNDPTDEELKDLVPNWSKKRRVVLLANLMSRCITWRMRFISRIQRYLSVDLYGRCATVNQNIKRCPGHYMKDCPVISEYLFYLVLENSNCRQYITEKTFHNAYAKGAIPVIVETPLVDCLKLLPPNSFLHLDNFKSLKHLAKEMYDISKDLTKLLSYHAWRNNFEIVEEHGFLGVRSLALCRVCEAINYNDRGVKIYTLSDIRLYLDPDVSCVHNKKW